MHVYFVHCEIFDAKNGISLKGAIIAKIVLSGWRVWDSIFIKNLAHYSFHENFGLFIKIRPIIH